MGGDGRHGALQSCSAALCLLRGGSILRRSMQGSAPSEVGARCQRRSGLAIACGAPALHVSSVAPPPAQELRRRSDRYVTYSPFQRRSRYDAHSSRLWLVWPIGGAGVVLSSV